MNNLNKTNQNFGISFELFPAKTDKGETELKSVINELSNFSPEFISVTYGAGGSTREKTFDIVKSIKDNTKVKPAAHLTCVAASKSQIDEIIQGYIDEGIKHIVALRGDNPDMSDEYQSHPEGYNYSYQLVDALKKTGKFQISVAAFPETHPEANSSEDDLKYLKQKIDAGADRAITQYCFDTDKIIDFIDRAKNIGITKPIVPGIVMINNFDRIVSFSKRCGASVPDWLSDKFSQAADDKNMQKKVAIDVAYQQCKKLLDSGVENLHFYTLNKSDIASDVIKRLKS